MKKLALISVSLVVMLILFFEYLKLDIATAIVYYITIPVTIVVAVYLANKTKEFHKKLSYLLLCGFCIAHFFYIISIDLKTIILA